MRLTRRQEVPETLPTRRLIDPFEMLNELMRWDPLREPRRTGEYIPAFDVKETANAYVFCADLPGMTENDVELSITGNRLIVSGHREEEKREENDRVYTYERSYGTFSRSFALPDGVDTDDISADLKNGVLTLTVPKKPEVQARRIPLLGKKRSGHEA